MSLARSIILPILAAVLAVTALFAPDRDDTPRQPTTVTIAQSSYACPTGSVITVAAGQVVAGTSSSATVLPDRGVDQDLQQPQGWRTAKVDGEGVIVRQEGTGSGAVGFFAGTAPKSGGGGLVVGSCPGVVDDAWFLGLGSGGKHFSTLILTNLADSPAAVDLELWGPDGPIDAVETEGLVVDPFTVRRIRLDTLAAGEPELAVRVHRRRGSLSAIVNDTSTSTFKGTEPITATATPRREQVVGGIVEGARGRTLLVLNPGGDTARVDVDVIGAKGTFAAEGLAQVKVPAGSVRAVPVPSSTGSGRQALRITSDEPVSATVRMAPTNTDYAYAESVAALDGPVVVPVDLGAGIEPPDLVLSAPGGDAKVDLQAFDADMAPVANVSVAVEGGTTRRVDVAKVLKADDIAYLVVQTDDEVVAAATFTTDDGISSLALTGAPITILGPQVRPAN